MAWSFWRFWRGSKSDVTQAANGATSTIEPVVKRSPLRIGLDFRGLARMGQPRRQYEPFKPTHPAPHVLPPSHKIAMDSGFVADVTGWAAGAIGGIFAEGQAFLGFPELSLLAQRPEYRVIAETIATEMTRKWIELTATGDDKADKIKRINAELTRLNVRKSFHEVAEQDGFFRQVSSLYRPWNNRQ